MTSVVPVLNRSATLVFVEDDWIREYEPRDGYEVAPRIRTTVMMGAFAKESRRLRKSTELVSCRRFRCNARRSPNEPKNGRSRLGSNFSDLGGFRLETSGLRRIKEGPCHLTGTPSMSPDQLSPPLPGLELYPRPETRHAWKQQPSRVAQRRAISVALFQHRADVQRVEEIEHRSHEHLPH